MTRSLSPETLAAQALGDVDADGAIIPAIPVSTTYLRDPDNQYRSGLSYGRPDNALVRRVERVLAELERGADALLFGSGMAAATAVFQGLRPGDHVVAPSVMYWSLRNWLKGIASDWGLHVDLVDTSDLSALRAALRPGHTKLVWLETPANPLWTITDIAEAARLAHQAGARLAVDSTAATPVLTRPLTLGADLVMHSATKYLNGHTDVVAGALVTADKDEAWTRLTAIRAQQGGILGPFEAALLLRGIRTLYLRVRQSSATAQMLAERLKVHPKISAVLYPGLKEHPGHEIAARQMSGGFGGMMSIRVAGGERHAVATAANVRLWKRATSLGGVESLIEHRASVEGPGTPAPPDLLRLSVGVEDAEDLYNDLADALTRAAAAR
jgi:cystathionine gamma-synthase